MDELIRTRVEPDGVLVATIDMPGRKMNVFSAELMDALDALLDRVDGDSAIASVVLTSGKPTFLAGADLVMVRGFSDAAKTATADELRALCGRLGRQLGRLEASAKPWVAAVNGLALGGGLELAMACRARLVADDARTQLGLPEVRWGLLPGAGGTQRLPRLVGFAPAMQLLLSGRSMGPAEALRLGLFVAAPPPAELLDTAMAMAHALHGRAFVPEDKYAHVAQTDVPPPGAASQQKIAADCEVSEEQLRHYPAYGAIIDSVLTGARRPLCEATELEMTQFLKLMIDPIAGRMVRTLYLERLRADRALTVPAGLRIERLALGSVSASRTVWKEAFGRLKPPLAPLSEDAALPADTLEIYDSRDNRHRIVLRAVDEPAHAVGPAAVLSPIGPYGRVLEIVGASDEAAAALAMVATRLSALAWRTTGPRSVLQQLHGRSLDEQAALVLTIAAEPAFLDVAACLAGVTPAYSGGPLTYGRGQ
jgi:3-hydroxyacyl-CoA dehydrogenase/enoyl-CoA hydratase/3-hydroxybutyryl-CoA epimerase